MRIVDGKPICRTDGKLIECDQFHLKCKRCGQIIHAGDTHMHSEDFVQGAIS